MQPDHQNPDPSTETAASRPEAGALHGYRSGRPFRIALFVVLAVAVVAAVVYVLARS